MMTDEQLVTNPPSDNPYVGPRTFVYEQRHLFFGREREARDLLARTVSERVLLFYAQSGAGKSSLLHTRLIPQLREEEGFAVLPVGRVGGELPAGVTDVENIYLFNLMSSLDGSDVNPQRLARLRLSYFLAHLTSDDGERWYYVPPASMPDLDFELARITEDEAVLAAYDEALDVVPAEIHEDGSTPAQLPGAAPTVGATDAEQRYVLIIDQFEEIITTHAHRRRDREIFFRQLNQALLDDANLWVVLTLREDYVAALDPYAHLMADKLRARFYMERMGVGAALDAVKHPGALSGRPFGEGVAEALVDNLRRVKVAGIEDDQLGHYVEPVQLQVVCYQLWENLQAKAHDGSDEEAPAISLADLREFGDIDQALANFYENALAQVRQQDAVQVSELLLRNWFGKQLITEAGTRGLIFRGDSHTGDIPNDVATALAKTFLLRAELRSGGIWYELIHDRFIVPILDANQLWLRQQPPLTRAAQAWIDSSRTGAHLLRGRLLRDAQRELPQDADPLLIAFLAASAEQAEAEQRHFWNTAPERGDRLPPFAQSYAVVLRIGDRNRLTGTIATDETQERTITQLGGALQNDHGYAVHLQQDDVTLHWLTELLTELLPRELTAQDRLLLYITGAALVRNNEWYLVPEGSTADYTHELLSLTQLGEWLQGLLCRHTLLVLDGIHPDFSPAVTQLDQQIPPVLQHQAQYTWYTTRVAHQVIATTSQTTTSGVAAPLHFAESFLALDEVRQAVNHLANLAPTGILTAQAFAHMMAEESAASRGTAGVAIWRQAGSNGGEYLFLLPHRQPAIAPAPTLTRDENPYRGLEAYDDEDAQLFFGRTRLIRELIAQVTARPLTVVLGASGTGKSSLVKAGLAPQLRTATTTDEYSWQVLSPIRPVNTPLQQLANLLVTEPPTEPIIDRAAAEHFDISPLVEEQSTAIFDTLAVWFAAHTRSRLLLIVDQLEEVVTMCRREEERRAFIALMARLLTEFPAQMRIVFTIRSDFEPHFAGSALGGALQADWRLARYVVTPMNRTELSEVIERPAALHYLDFQPPALVDQLIDEVEQTPGALSLLSFSLSELFLKYVERNEAAQQRGERTPHALTAADYEELGGVIGSLSRRATALYDQLDAAHQATMQRVMLRMIAVEGGELARRRVPRAELDYSLAAENVRVNEVIAQMAATQLVLEGSDEAGIPYVEPAHDALVRAWDKLLVWKREAEDIIPLQRRLTQVAGEWHNSQSSEKQRLLWHNDPRLALLQQELIPVTPPKGPVDAIFQSIRTTLWPKTTITEEPTWLNRLETEFVRQSIVRRARNWQQISLLILVVVITLATVASIAEYNRRQAIVAQSAAEQERSAAEVARETAISAEATAISAKATAEADAVRANAAEAEARKEESNARLSEAERAVLETIARSRQYAAQSTIELNRGQINLALLTALEARHALTLTNLTSLDDSQEAYAAVRAAVEQNQSVPLIYNDVGGDVLDITWDSAERRALIRTDHGPVYVWDRETGGRVSIESSSDMVSGTYQCPAIRFPVWEASWNKAEDRFLTRSPDGTVRIWDAATGETVTQLRIGSGGTWNITVTADNRCVYSYEKNGERIELDRLGGHDDDIWEVLWSDDESRLLIRMGDGTVRLWDIATERELSVLRGHERDVWGMQWSNDEARVLTYGDDDTARIWAAESGEELLRLTGHTADIVAAQWDQVEARVMTRSADGTMRIWNGDTGEELARLEDGLFLAQAIWSQDEERVLTYGGSVAQIWNLAQPEEPLRLIGHDAALLQATWSSDGSRVLSHAADWTVRVWNAQSGEELAHLAEHDGDIFQAIWSNDERRVLTASNDGTARIWEIESGTVIALTGHAGAVWEARWNADESRVLTRGADDSVRIWDSSSGQELVRFTGHDGYVRGAAWLQAEDRVFTFSNDNTVRIWYTDREELVAGVCDQVLGNMDSQEWVRIMGAESYQPTCPNAPLPDDVIAEIQEQITASIQRGALAVALEEAAQLEGWLQQSGQRDKSLIPLVFNGYAAGLQQLVHAGKLAEAEQLAEAFHAVQVAQASPDAPPLSARTKIALILHDIGVALAQNGDIDRATEQFTLAQAYDYPEPLSPRQEAQHIAGQQWLDRARSLVERADVAQVQAALAEAIALDPTLTIDPAPQAQQMVARFLLDQGSVLVVGGDVAAAQAKFAEAFTLIAPGELSNSTDFVRQQTEPLVVDARRLLYAGDLEGAFAQFAQHRAHTATVQQANRLAEASFAVVKTPPLNQALLLAIEAKRLIATLDAPTAAERAQAEQALWTVMAELQRTQPLLPLLLDRGSRAESDWGDFWHATWSNDERRILLHDSRGLVYLWNLTDDTVRSRYHQSIYTTSSMNYGYPIWEALWNTDESLVLTRGEDGNARIWDLETGTMVEFYGHNDGVYQGDIWQATWSNDETKLLTRGSDGTARIWDTATGQEWVRMEGHAGEVWQATWNADESQVLTRSDDDTARIWDAATGRELVRFIGHTGDIRQALWSSSERHVLTTAADGTARIWDAERGQELVRFDGHTGSQLVAEWSDDNARLLTYDSDSVHLWDVDNGQELSRFATAIGPLLQVVWSKAEAQVLTRSADNTVRLWDAATGAEVLRLQGHAGAILQATWSRDERRILTAGVDGTARVWDSASGRELTHMTGHDGAVYEATWSPAEDRVLTRGDDLTVRVWDAANGREIIRFVGHTERIQQATWNHDGTRVLTRSDDGSVRIWYVDQAPLLAIACQEASANLTWATWSDLMGELPYHLTCPGAPIPSDVLAHFQTEIHALLAANATSDAITLTQQLAEWFAVTGGDGPAATDTLLAFLEQEMRSLVRTGQEADALTLYNASTALRQRAQPVVRTTSGEVFIALELMNIGTELAKAGKIEEAALTFATATEWDATLTVDPERDTRAIAAAGMIEEAHAAANALDLAKAIDLYTQARSLDPALTFDPEASAKLVIIARRRALAEALVAQDDVTGALEQYAEAVQLADSINAPQAATLRAAAVTLLLDEGRQLAQMGMLDEATALFAHAVAYDETIGIDPATEAALWAAVTDVRVLLADRRYGEAMSQLYALAEMRPTLALTETLTADEWERLCRQGSLLGEAQIVLPACRWALALEPMNRDYLDSYGIALALTDDLTGAIDAFEESIRVADMERGLVPSDEQTTTASDNLREAETGDNKSTGTDETVRRQRVWLQLLRADINPIVAYVATASGALKAALAIYAEVEAFALEGTLSAWEWNNLCWQGALHGHVLAVLDACGQAVALEPENGNYRDSRGVARSLIGDRLGAIEDFTAYVNSAPTSPATRQRQQWIRALQVGTNPVRAYVATLTGDLPTALAFYEESQATSAADLQEWSISAEEWNSLCWRGAQEGYAAKVIFACEAAVALEPENGNYRDSRGIARALTGDLQGAVEDLLFALDWAEAAEAQEEFIFKRKSLLMALRTLQFSTGSPHSVAQWLAEVAPTYLGDWAALQRGSASAVPTEEMASTGERTKTVGITTTAPISTVVAVDGSTSSTETTTMQMDTNSLITLSPAAPAEQQSSAPTNTEPETLEDAGQSLPLTTIPVPSGLLTRTVRIGVMGRNTSDFDAIDYAILREAKIESVVLLSNINPRVFAQIKRDQPDTLIITRLYYPNSQTLRPNAQQFIETMIPVIAKLQPYSDHFQILNEPNHVYGSEGWGSSNEDAQQFNDWFLTVYAGLKAAHPWAKLGFPGLAVPDELHRDKAWLAINEGAINRADWLGVHTYWQTRPDGDSTLFADCCGLNFTYYHEHYPAKVIHITEYGNANGADRSYDMNESLYAEEYAQWLNHLFNYPYIGSASAFILSSMDSSWHNYSWRTEAGHVTAIVSAVGNLPRPPLVEPQPNAPVSDPQPPPTPSEVEAKPAAEADEARGAPITGDEAATVAPSTASEPTPAMVGVAPENNAFLNYEVQIDTTATAGALSYWRAVRVRHLPLEENRGMHSIFVDTIDENGQPLRDLALQLDWGLEGQDPDMVTTYRRFDRPPSEPATDVNMQYGPRYWVRISGDGLPSEVVFNLHTDHPDETSPAGETWNSLGHHSFHIVFQRTRRTLAMPFADSYPVAQEFGANPEFYGRFSVDGVALQGYNYVDFGLPLQTPVYATDEGTVLRTGSEETGLGNYVLLSHAWGESLYAHLDYVDVAEGERIARGAAIGFSGQSGAVFGPVLSFGIRINPYDRADGWGGFRDPLPYLQLTQ